MIDTLERTQRIAAKATMVAHEVAGSGGPVASPAPVISSGRRRGNSSPSGPGAGGDRSHLPRVICQKIRAAVKQGLTLHVYPTVDEPRIMASEYPNSSTATVIVKCATEAELWEMHPVVEDELRYWTHVKAVGGDMEAAI